jgi:HAD superfamily hydrolase (TIGR01490 family)
MTTPAQSLRDLALALRPRAAAFDCDGTLWDADSGMEFFYWIIAQGLVDKETAARALPRYEQYRAGRVPEETMCGEMVQVCRGLSVEGIKQAARAFFRQNIQPLIFPEMLALTTALRDQGCELWAVSSSNQWLIEVEAEPFGFVPERILSAAVEEEDGIATDRLLRVPTGPSKAAILRERAGSIDLGFGNSVHDVAMLELAGRAFAVHPNPDLEEMARARGWAVFQPAPVTRTLTR